MPLGRGASPPGTRGRRAPRWRTTAATRAQVRLDIDAPRLEADERERDRATEHGSTVLPNMSRDCDGSVPGS